jgi:fructose-bisphosphate aldolase class II
VNNLEQVLAIMQAAVATDSPVIIQASAGARHYAGNYFLWHLMQAALETYPDIPIVIHQDHGSSPAICMQALRLGFSSVMMDGSLQADGKTPADYEYNVAVTKQVVDFSHAVGVSVEGELGCLGNLETQCGQTEDGHGAQEVLSIKQLLTDPEEAYRFVETTKIDALAIAIGTSHGAYKFNHEPVGDVLAMARLKAIHRRLPNTHLVMHGASSVPQNLLVQIRELGSNIHDAWGVPIAEIQRSIQYGVRKINIDTDIRLAMTVAIRQHFLAHRNEFDLRKPFQAAIEAAATICTERFEAFGAAGHAGKIKPISLDKMANRYTA